MYLFGSILIFSIILYLQKKKIKNYLISWVIKNVEDKKSSFCRGPGQVARITYYRNNSEYNLYIPYSIKSIPGMLGNSIFLIKGNERINITQQPGIPYLVKLEDFCGDYFEIISPEGQIYQSKSLDITNFNKAKI